MTDIVELTSENAALFEHIAPDVFDNPIDPVQLSAFLADPRHVMLLAVERGAVVGMASAVEYFHPDKPPQLWVNEVGVASTHRRRGIGRALVEAVVGAGQKRGCSCAWLGTETDNTAGKACFDSLSGGETPQPFLLYEWESAS